MTEETFEDAKKIIKIDIMEIDSQIMKLQSERKLRSSKLMELKIKYEKEIMSNE